MFLSFLNFYLPEWIRIGGSLYTYLYDMHQVAPTLCLPLLGEMSSQQGISPKEALARTPKQTPFSPHHQITPFKSFDQWLTPLWLDINRWCPDPCVSSTILCVCLLLLPHHSCHSCLVLFCCVYWVCAYLPRHEGCVGFWTRTASLHFPHGLGIVQAEVPTRLVHQASISAIPFPIMPMSLLAVIPTTLAHWIYYSSLGLSRPIYFTFIFYYVHGSINCHSYHVGLLSLLPLFLSFLSPFALLLPLIVSMSLLAVIPVMLVH